MPPTSIPTAGIGTLWLVRHGESTWNTLGLTQGHNDQAELTGRGRRQAAEVAERFAEVSVRAIYASDLRRAQQTAAPLAAAAGVPVVLDARLRERNLGVLEGTLAAGNGPSVTGLDLKAGLLTDPDTRPEGGESVRDLYRRAAAFCHELQSSGGRPPVPPGCAPDGKDRQLIGRAESHSLADSPEKRQNFGYTL
jgi:broad specificity phosphatase PhoE